MRVGTSLRRYQRDIATEDHPHACGDKKLTRQFDAAVRGSSPCVWGQVVLTTSCCKSYRIIPMRVGTSTTACALTLTSRDHPHACGDKVSPKGTRHYQKGSSPCVWGQADNTSFCFIVYRIIPMRVGTRLKKSRKIAVLQNQPLRFPLTFHRSFV